VHLHCPRALTVLLQAGKGLLAVKQSSRRCYAESTSVGDEHCLVLLAAAEKLQPAVFAVQGASLNRVSWLVGRHVYRRICVLLMHLV
jgi:hypothetical protein